jgi:hypothetical protein
LDLKRKDSQIAELKTELAASKSKNDAVGIELEEDSNDDEDGASSALSKRKRIGTDDSVHVEKLENPSKHKSKKDLMRKVLK